MTLTKEGPRPAFSGPKATKPSHPSDYGVQDTPSDLFKAMIHMQDLHRIQRAWIGQLLRATPDAARDALHQLLPGDITDPRLTIAARAIWHALHDGEDTGPRTVAQAAYRHRLVPEADHAVFYAFLVDLSQCEPPRRGVLDAATTAPHMAHALVHRRGHR